MACLFVILVAELFLLVCQATRIGYSRTALSHRSASSLQGKPEWVARYAGCSTLCGSGVEKMVMAVCMQGGRVVADDACNQKAKPVDKKCEEHFGCEWRLGGVPKDGCGWAREALCFERGGEKAVDKAFCEKIIAESGDDFLLRTGRINGKCKGTELAKICVATMNHESGLDDATRKGEELVTKCGDVDAIVIATQGLTQTSNKMFWTVFESFGEGLRPFVPVSRCGGKISAGVLVLAHESKEHLFAPLRGACITEDKAGNWRLLPNMFRTKMGSVILEVHTVSGVLAAASTHGPTGGTISSNRTSSFEATVNHILGLSPKYVAWGGDFNMRIPFENEDDSSILSLGVTHPPPDSEGVDQKPEWTAMFNPTAAYDRLRGFLDILGSEKKTLAQELESFSDGILVEVDGVRDLCPSYSKAGGAGETPSYWGDLVGRRDARPWLPNFACQAPGREVEYYMSPLSEKDGKVKWSGESSQAPSWTDRLIVSQATERTLASTGKKHVALVNAETVACGRPEKILVATGHDVILSVCKLQ